MSTLSQNQEIHNCPHCGQPRAWYEQSRWNGGVIVLGECRNEVCDLNMITLDDAQWLTVTEEELARYSESMANVRRVQGAA